MPVLKITKNKNYVIGLWHLTENEKELIKQLDNFSQYSSQLERITSQSRRREWVCARVLLNTIIKENKIIAYHPNGAPYLSDNSFNISISHTKGYVCVIVSKEKKVAVDIEYYSERVEKVSSRFIRNDEKVNSFMNTKLWSMLLFWSAKETAYKILGKENVDFLKHLKINEFVPQQKGIFSLTEYFNSESNMFLISYEICDDYVMTWSTI